MPVTRVPNIRKYMNTAAQSNPSSPADPLLERMKRHPFLKDMLAAQLAVLRESAMGTRFAAGETIFVEGDPANRFYLIESGQVELHTAQRDQQATVIQTIGAGNVVGWSWLFPPYYWHFSAIATAPTEAIFFYGTRLRELAEQDHHLGYDLLKRVTEIMIERLQSTRKQLLQLQSRR